MTATALAVDESSLDPRDAGVFDMTHSGLRFVDDATEREYRLWHARSTLPFQAPSVAALALALALVMVAQHWAAVPRYALIGATSAWMLLVALPRLYVARRPALLLWVQPLAGLSMANAGCIVVGVWSWGFVHRPDFGLVGAVLVTFFLFGIVRLRPAAALAAALPVWLVHAGCLAFTARAWGIGAFTLAIHAASGVGTLFAGFIAGVAADRSSRAQFRQERVIEAQQRAIERERERADRLLHTILPVEIADRLKRTPGVIADKFEELTVVFADIVGFTPLAASISPEQVVDMLNELFTLFDELAARIGVEKIKTIGDAYMAVAGLPKPREDHAIAAAEFALAMKSALSEYSERGGRRLQARIGMCSGSVVAGVIGARKLAYDLWGDTVNTAARMEAHGVPGQIQVAEPTYQKLRDAYLLEERGMIDVKGKGPMPTWLLSGPG